MYQYQSQIDTIAAIATAPGAGGIGIVRLSGQESLSIVDKIFVSKTSIRIVDSKTHRVIYGWIKIQDKVIDEVVVTLMRKPKSYTTEDVVEINCHGGPTAVRTVLQLCLDHGARLAEPGEFTKRAFIYGRIDLTQAEAVLDVINAKTQAFLRVSTNQLTGELSTELQQIREVLMLVFITIEAVINFPEDDLNAEGREQIFRRLSDQKQRVKKLLDSSENGRLLKEGIRLVLCGKPNVGKSSLLNVLLKQQRAIVTDIAGTTRDVLEETAQIGGMPFQLVDTAGILEPRDLVEKEAIKRSHLYIDSADLVLLVIDTSRQLDEADQILIDKLQDRNVLVVLNKSDLPSKIDVSQIPFTNQVSVSAETKNAIDQLEQAIVKAVTHGASIDPPALMVSNLRHIQALKEAHGHLNHAISIQSSKIIWEVIAEDIKLAVNHLDAITGRNIDADLVDRIFSEFCIGK